MSNWTDKLPVPLQDFGTYLTISGIVFQGNGDEVIIMYPDTVSHPGAVNLTHDEFKAFMRQVDLQEVTLFKDDPLRKAVVRKSQRQLDPRIVWEVYHRDGYRCRYCGRQGGGVQMTYDHVKLWEEGGETSVENGVCACKKCNNTRGNTDFADWLNSDYYKSRINDIGLDTHMLNVELLRLYRNFPDRVSKRRR